MQEIRGWILVSFALTAGVFLLVQRQVFAKPVDERKADREAIAAVLSAQQNVWNRGDVDAFLAGYWGSPELTFSGNSGGARGWVGWLARYKKNIPLKAR